MKYLNKLSVLSILGLCALPAFASNHTGIDQWGHFSFHFQQMLFWASQGQWSLAFYQADCTRDPLSKLLFVHGGMLWLTSALLAVSSIFYLRKQAAQLFHQRTWFLRFRKYAFA